MGMALGTEEGEVNEEPRRGPGRRQAHLALPPRDRFNHRSLQRAGSVHSLSHLKRKPSRRREEEKGSAGSDGCGYPERHQQQRGRFEVKKWNAIAVWAWDIVVDNCAICRNHIMDLCIECQATSEERTVAWGSVIMLFIPLHLSLAQNTTGVSIGQQRVGIPKVWALGKDFFHQA
ncbi:hypothetical protein H8959_004978 [Pygathrix nigripes]